MPPKTKFDKEAIVDAAFEIAKEAGFSGIAARSVAKRLGSSVAPIYVNFENIDDLITAVVERVFALSDQLLAQQEGPHIFANIGKASLAFARDYPVLFRELILQPNPYMASYETVEHALVEALGADEQIGKWSVAERKRFLLKMRIFQLGLSALVANNHLPTWLDEQSVEKLLFEVGEDLYQVEEMKQKEKS
jgi:AcrR family transcriptional regulator